MVVLAGINTASLATRHITNITYIIIPYHYIINNIQCIVYERHDNGAIMIACTSMVYDVMTVSASEHYNLACRHLADMIHGYTRGYTSSLVSYYVTGV